MKDTQKKRRNMKNKSIFEELYCFVYTVDTKFHKIGEKAAAIYHSVTFSKIKVGNSPWRIKREENLILKIPGLYGRFGESMSFSFDKSGLISAKYYFKRYCGGGKLKTWGKWIKII